jgi:hypothetical protein
MKAAMEEERDGTQKKPYVTPTLVAYGDIRQITQTFPSGNGMNETATTGADKTGP